MPTIAIVGAGPGLGSSLGKIFGRHSYDVALVSRSKDNLATLAAGLAEHGVIAEGFAADVADPASLTAALEAATARFGRIDVLEFSPYVGLVQVFPAEVIVDNLAPAIQEILHNTLADQGIYAGVVAVNAMISDNAPDGYPAIAPDSLAQHYWDLHTQRGQAELVLPA
ncbi:hypothetical protein Aros01_04669 [Streptosporangium roseum]|uniref:SDR family NAD(P)-dependent oxidoreductase n=1 Tax=Streptosporangium roseum TaxID=2001 RepID=UPI00309AEDCD